MTRTQLGPLGALALIASGLLTGCNNGDASATDKSMCQLASDYMYYGHYLGGQFGEVPRGDDLRVLDKQIIRTMSQLRSALPSSRQAQLERVQKPMEYAVNLRERADYVLTDIPRSQIDKYYAMGQKATPTANRLTSWLEDQCKSEVDGWAERPADAPSDLPVNPH